MTKFDLHMLESDLGINYLCHIKPIQEAAEMIKVKDKYLVYVLLAAAVAVTSLPYVRVATFFVATLLVPMLISVKDLEKEMAYNSHRWMGYWLIYGSWVLFDGSVRLVFTPLPVYWFFRIFTLVFLYSSVEYGSAMIYGKFLEPTFQVALKYAARYVAMFEDITEIKGVITK